MALLFADGFDHYSGPDLLRKWSLISSGLPSYSVPRNNFVDISPEWARPPGGMALRTAQGDANSYIMRSLPTNPATIIVGFNFYTGAWATNRIISLMDNATTQVDMRSDGAGHFTLTRNGTLLATSSNVFLTNVWYHVELKVTIHNTTGAYELRVNGSAWIGPTSSANTRASVNNYANQVYLNQFSGDHRTDDFYVLDDSGSVANNFLGPSKIITLFPNAAGNYDDWTGNYADNFANLNELIGDGDWSFNQSLTAGHKDSFGFDDIATGTIHAIQHAILARQDAGAARTMRSLLRISGTDYTGTTQSVPGTHQYLLQPVSANPATSTAFTATVINGMEAGYELVS